MLQLNNIGDRAMLVGLQIKQFSPSKTDKQLNQELVAKHGQASDMTRVSRSLIGKEHLDALKSKAGAIRAEHYRRTLPWDADGSQILTQAGYAGYQEFIRTAKDEWDGLVQDFLDKWPDIVKDARAKLNGLFVESDYPSVNVLREKFGIRSTIRPVPTGDDFRVTLSENEVSAIRASIESDLADTVKTAMQSVWSQMRDVVSKMVERLKAYNPQSPKDAPFRDSLVQNIRDLLDILPSLNLTDDPNVAQFAADMGDLVKFDADELRDNAWKRDDTARRAQTILDNMAAFIA